MSHRAAYHGWKEGRRDGTSLGCRRILFHSLTTHVVLGLDSFLIVFYPSRKCLPAFAQ